MIECFFERRSKPRGRFRRWMSKPGVYFTTLVLACSMSILSTCFLGGEEVFRGRSIPESRPILPDERESIKAHLREGTLQPESVDLSPDEWQRMEEEIRHGND
jgi:hypothetical protein